MGSTQAPQKMGNTSLPNTRSDYRQQQYQQNNNWQQKQKNKDLIKLNSLYPLLNKPNSIPKDRISESPNSFNDLTEKKAPATVPFKINNFKSSLIEVILKLATISSIIPMVNAQTEQTQGTDSADNNNQLTPLSFTSHDNQISLSHTGFNFFDKLKTQAKQTSEKESSENLYANNIEDLCSKIVKALPSKIQFEDLFSKSDRPKLFSKLLDLIEETYKQKDKSTLDKIHFLFEHTKTQIKFYKDLDNAQGKYDPVNKIIKLRPDYLTQATLKEESFHAIFDHLSAKLNTLTLEQYSQLGLQRLDALKQKLANNEVLSKNEQQIKQSIQKTIKNFASVYDFEEKKVLFIIASRGLAAMLEKKNHFLFIETAKSLLGQNIFSTSLPNLDKFLALSKHNKESMAFSKSIANNLALEYIGTEIDKITTLLYETIQNNLNDIQKNIIANTNCLVSFIDFFQSQLNNRDESYRINYKSDPCEEDLKNIELSIMPTVYFPYSGDLYTYKNRIANICNQIQKDIKEERYAFFNRFTHLFETVFKELHDEINAKMAKIQEEQVCTSPPSFTP